jgi:hypothetical protein
VLAGSAIMLFKATVPNTFAQMSTWRAVAWASKVTASIVSLCDCGEAKLKYSEACERCKFLDGIHRAEIRVIAYLRDNVEVSTDELCMALHIDYRQLHRLLDRLIATGRLARRLEEHLTEKSDKGHQRNRGRTLKERWMYRLCADGGAR